MPMFIYVQYDDKFKFLFKPECIGLDHLDENSPKHEAKSQ